MSLGLGQLRQNQLELSDYETVLIESGTEDNIFNYPGFNAALNFDYSDGAIVLSKEKVNFNAGVTYDITLSLDSNIIGEIDIKLCQEPEANIYKPIKRTSVKYGVNNLRFIFTPDVNYTYIVFEIKARQSADAICSPIADTIKIKQLMNIINYLSNRYSNFSYIKKFGLQGPVGLRFSLNEDEFQLNSTGILTLEDTNVSQLAFSLDSGAQPFIMDFQY